MTLPNGQNLQNGKYQITHVIGQGGFGITYKGIWHTEVKGSLGVMKTEVPICIKEYFFKDYCYREEGTEAVKVHSETGRMLFERFKEKLIKEAKILSEIHHPHIVNVLEVFEENNTAYIAMEYIAGCSLKSLLDKEEMLSETKVLTYVRQIGDALQFVHAKHILHLDIKPSNILIDTADQAHLIDFGVSKRYDIEQQETSTTMLTLSKGFASIEQYDNEGISNFSSCPDIYSLGATMYNLLTGKIPTESILRATRSLQKPSEFNAAVSPKTEAVILKAMELIPSNRFQTVREMMETLDFPAKDVKEELQTASPLPQKELSVEEEETTLLNADLPQGTSDDGGVSKKKTKTQKIFLAFIILFLCIGTLLASYYWKQKPAQSDNLMSEKHSAVPKMDKDSVQIADTEEEPEHEKAAIKNEQPEPSVVPAKKETEMAEIKKQTEKENKPAPSAPQNTPKSDNLQPKQPTQEAVDAKYAALIASGKDNMQKSDFSNARKDFTEAKNMKLTEEAIRLLIACDEQEEARHLADRKSQYEIKMPFGKVTIVRKKKTRMYGAIDNDANERIPCKYVNVGITENGRAFEREDGLYDIYNTDGKLVNEGITNY